MPNSGDHLLEELMRFKPDGLSPNGWAVKAGVGRNIWADLKRHGNPSRKTLEKLLAAAGTSLAEFEALRIGRPAAAVHSDRSGLAEINSGWRPAILPPMPLLAIVLAGEWGPAGSGIDLHAIDRSMAVGRLDRPSSLAADHHAYATCMAGKSMWPRFRAGRRLLVSPGAPVAAGDDVLVQLAGGRVLIKELVSRLVGEIKLRQFNPDVTFAVEAAGVEAIHKIVGEAI